MTPDDPDARQTDPGAEPPPSRRDELASALVDGLLGEAEAAEARRVPGVAARAAEMDAARAALRAVPPADPPARFRAVAAALAAFEDDMASPVPGHNRSQVADLRARRRPPAPGRWLGVAAAAVLLIGVLVVGLVGSSSDDTSSDSATAALDSEESSGDSESAEQAEPGDTPSAAAPEGGDETDALTAPADLGTFSTADALVDAAAEQSAAQARGPADAGTADDAGGGSLAARCPGAGGAGDGALLVARGVVDGVTVEVWRTGEADAARLVVLDPACAVLAQRPLG